MSAGRDRHVYRVRAMSKEQIESWATFLWQFYPRQLQGGTAFPFVDFLERRMTPLLGVDLAIEAQLDGGALGETDAEDLEVRFSERVYRGIEAGNPEDCFTAAHEIIHALLHVEQYVTSRQHGLAMQRRRDIPAARDPEIQADYGAAAILIPREYIDRFGHCGLSHETHSKRLRAPQLAFNLRLGEPIHKRTKPILADRLWRYVDA